MKQKKRTPPEKRHEPLRIISHEIPFSRHLFAALFLFISIALAYANSLNGTWALDDTSIVKVKSVEENLNLAAGGRKIALLTFALNKWIAPDSPVSYRIINIIIHFSNAVLLYCISFMTLRLPALRERFSAFSFPVALLAGAAFALHPININAVSYIIQRMTSLATLFVMLALVCYILGRTSSGRTGSVISYACTAVCVLLGYLSKEIAVMAFPLLILYDYFFISPGGKDRFVWKTVIAGLILAGIFISFNILGTRSQLRDIIDLFLNFNRVIPWGGARSVDVSWTPLQHILTEFRVIARYLGLIIAPLPNLLVFDYWGFPVSTGILNPPQTLPAFLLIAGLLFFSLARFRKTPFLSFGILWYLCAVSLESFVVLGLDLYYEHRNYLPVAGLLFGITAQAVTSFRIRSSSDNKIYIAAVILALILGGLTFQRNRVWKDSVMLWTDTAEKAPGNMRALVSLGGSYMHTGDLASAAASYERALEADTLQRGPTYYRDAAHYLGMIYLLRGEMDKAEYVLRLMESKFRGSYTTETFRAFYNSVRNNPQLAASLKKNSSDSPKNNQAIVFAILGDSYRIQSNFDMAIDMYKKALDIDPSISVAYFGMGDAYFSKKDIEKAEIYFRKALSLDSNNPLVLARMADIMLIRKAPIHQAKDFAEKAVSLSPALSQPYETLAWVLIAMGRDDDAERYYQKAQQFGLRGYALKFSKARAYFLRGDKEKAKSLLRDVALMKDTPAEIRQLIERDLNNL